MPSSSERRSSVSRPSRAVCGDCFHLKNVDRPGEPSRIICSSALKSQSRAMLKNALSPAADISVSEGSARGRRDGVTEAVADDMVVESLIELLVDISPYMDYCKF